MHPLVLNSHLATNSLVYANESRKENPETRINLFAMTLVRPNMWSPSGKTDRPQFRLGKESVFLYEFSSSENYFRNFVEIHGIFIQLLSLGMKILVAGVSIFL